MTNHSDDPAVRWSAQLGSLFGRRRETVIKALRNSVDSGHPADAEGVRILVAYAQGQISARQYVAQILEALGFVPPAYMPAPVVRQPEPWREPVRRPDPSVDVLPQFTPRAAAPPRWRESWTDEPRQRDTFERTGPRQTSRYQAVQAYVTGQIPVEEFLRISRVRTA